MGATPAVLLLVGLSIPILMIAFALLLDVVVLLWAARQIWRNRMVPAIGRSAMFNRFHVGHGPLPR